MTFQEGPDGRCRQPLSEAGTDSPRDKNIFLHEKILSQSTELVSNAGGMFYEQPLDKQIIFCLNPGFLTKT
jgi:hypothetical protein